MKKSNDHSELFAAQKAATRPGIFRVPVVVFKTKDEKISVDVRFDEETVLQFLDFAELQASEENPV